MHRKLYKDQQGFTITELLIATAVFSVLLVGILSAFIKISDLFYKGVTMSKTQEDARNIVQSISDDIQFYAGAPDTFDSDNSTNPQSGRFCIGNHRYSYQIGTQVDSANDGLARDTVTGGDCTVAGTGKVKMLDDGMQLNKLKVDCSNGRCNVKIHVIFYGGDKTGLFYSPCSPSGCPQSYDYSPTPELAPDAQCTGGIESSDICATVDYDSTVLDNTP